MPKRIDSKSDRALELFEKGLESWQIAARIGSSVQSIPTLVSNGRERRRVREIERAGKLADIMGANV